MRASLLLVLALACRPTDTDPLAACAIGVSPASIDQAMSQLQELPEQTIPCFLASLERPLQAAASDSTTSTQPASAPDPRVFLFLDDLIVTTVASGPSVDQLEFSERFDNTRTVKAELRFPLPEAPDPYAEAAENAGTRCGVCHREEAPHPDHAGRFVSRALRPHQQQLVDLGDGALDHLACTTMTDRCVRLRALYGFGAIEPVSFGVGFDVAF